MKTQRSREEVTGGARAGVILLVEQMVKACAINLPKKKLFQERVAGLCTFFPRSRAQTHTCSCVRAQLPCVVSSLMNGFDLRLCLDLYITVGVL